MADEQKHENADGRVAAGQDAAAPRKTSSWSSSAADLEAAQDRLLRSQAELDNYRKRAAREIEDHRRYANLPLIRDLLPVLDNIERAIAAAETTPRRRRLAGRRQAGGQAVRGSVGAAPLPADPRPAPAVRPAPAPRHLRSRRPTSCRRAPWCWCRRAGFQLARPRGPPQPGDCFHAKRSDCRARSDRAHLLSSWKCAMPTYDYLCDACGHRVRAVPVDHGPSRAEVPGVRASEASPADRPRRGDRVSRLGFLYHRLPQRVVQEGGRGRQGRQRRKASRTASRIASPPPALRRARRRRAKRRTKAEV